MENLYGNCYDANKKQLNLSHRNLRTVDSALIASYGNRTEYLDLSHNRINNLSWLYEFPDLKCLIIDNNRIREAHLAKLTRPLINIHTLMLNKNELSDLKTTANILRQIFPNVHYLSLHGNAMCPDNLLLQPFSDFVPYEYNYYRAVLLKSLPNLKFLDHYSLDSLHLKSLNATQANDEKRQRQQQHQQLQQHWQQYRQKQQLLVTTSKEMWSKMKNFLTTNASHTTASEMPTTPTTTNNNNYSLHCAPSALETSHRNMNSEGNRYITNSDL